MQHPSKSPCNPSPSRPDSKPRLLRKLFTTGRYLSYQLYPATCSASRRTRNVLATQRGDGVMSSEPSMPHQRGVHPKIWYLLATLVAYPLLMVAVQDPQHALSGIRP